MQAAGFNIGGEPLVALDLVDTLMTVTDPWTDLMADRKRTEDWWRLQSPRLPAGWSAPDPAATRRLRAALRDLFDAHLAGRAPKSTSVEDINAAAAAVPTSPRLTGDGVETRWHTEYGGNAALAAIAREAIELFGDAERLGRLRRCANPACSMVFLAERKSRQWCASNVCGNRVRVARHHERRKEQS